MGASTSHVPFPDHSITWYRVPMTPEQKAELHQTSDVKGAIQTLSWLGMLSMWFALALYFHAGGCQLLAAAFVSLYGMQVNFAVNGMHELGHGWVFRTKWLNHFFLRIISFLGWCHPDMFFSSHLRHHRYTQNMPHDQENPMPAIYTWQGFLCFGFVNMKGFIEFMVQTGRAAFGMYPTLHLGWTPEWEDVCYPPSKPAAREPSMRWAQFMLLGDATIAIASLLRGWWLIPTMICLGPFYNGWLFFLCNSTQHVGLDHGSDGKTVTDFRLCSRTFYINNRLIECWYWHMNYHIEHHMYPVVPCYNLARLHEAIKHELPPTPNGFIEVWTVIVDVMRKQAKDPTYVQAVLLPDVSHQTPLLSES